MNTNYNLKAQPNFGAHVPRTFAEAMNSLYKKSNIRSNPNFAQSDIVILSTKLPNGKDLSATAFFSNGRFQGLKMDEDKIYLKRYLIKQILSKFQLAMAPQKLKNKLNTEKF